MAFGDCVEQVDKIILRVVIIAQPVDYLFACVPDAGCDEIEQILAFIIDSLE